MNPENEMSSTQSAMIDKIDMFDISYQKRIEDEIEELNKLENTHVERSEEKKSEEIKPFKKHFDSKAEQFKETLLYLYQYRLKENYKVLLVGVFVILMILNTLINLKSFLLSIYYVDYSYIHLSFFSVLFLYIPFLVFVYSTEFKYWNFHRQKVIFLGLCVFNVILTILKVCYFIIYLIFIPITSRLKPVEGVTKEMIVALMRIELIIPTVLLLVYMTYHIYKIVSNPESLNTTLQFKITKYVDRRENKKYLYDVTMIQYMKNGNKFLIRETDRFLHMMINGSTGTGKTSSTMSVQIVDDLDKKILNEDKQKKLVLNLLKKGQVYMTHPFNDEEFSINNFRAKEGFEHKLEEIITTYRSCGLTVIAPNAGLTDEIYNLCVARNIPCNRVDPMPDEEKEGPKDGFIGLNPFYLSPSIPSWRRQQEIVKKATLFSDVLAAINDSEGKSDPYFSGINRSLTNAISICLIVAFPELNNKKQPNPSHVQYIINDFSRIQKYYDQLSAMDKDKDFQFVTDFIAFDMLGPGAKSMFDQSRGLRNMINQFLTNPLIKRTICTDHTIDMDKMLEQGQVTVINYALELGTTNSTAFGSFALLSLIDAVLRRPGTEKTRLPHFIDIDELPVLINNQQIETMFSLFRQYRASMIVAIQTYDQMEKSEMTRYLKGVIIGNCAHHIVFGRASLSDMKIYSSLAGKEYRTVQQDSVSETSLTTENPTKSFSTRTALQQENIVEEVEIRERDFQEVTVYSTVNGNLIRPFHGRVSFMEKYKKRRFVKRFRVDWMNYYNNESIPLNLPPEDLFDNKIFLTSNGVTSSIPLHQISSINVIDKVETEHIKEDSYLENEDTFDSDDEFTSIGDFIITDSRAHSQNNKKNTDSVKSDEMVEQPNNGLEP